MEFDNVSRNEVTNERLRIWAEMKRFICDRAGIFDQELGDVWDIIFNKRRKELPELD